MQSDDDDTETHEELRRGAIDNAEVTYSIKLISPLNHNGDKPQKWTNTRFSDVARLQSEIKSDFGNYFDGENFEIGYIEPGHGARGRQVPIVYTEDLTRMYSRCNRASSGSRVRRWPDSGDQQEVGGPAKKSRCGKYSLQQAHDPGSGSSSLVTHAQSLVYIIIKCLSYRKLLMNWKKYVLRSTPQSSYELGATWLWWKTRLIWPSSWQVLFQTM